jgi:excisionase family DNA binding protein
MWTSVFIDQAASMLGVSRRTVYYRIREGRLQTVRTRCGSQRVLLASILALMREDGPLLRDSGAGASATIPFERSPAR